MRKEKDLKTRIRVSSSINIEIWNNLQMHSEETMIPISKLLDKAISNFLNKEKEDKK